MGRKKSIGPGADREAGRAEPRFATEELVAVLREMVKGREPGQADPQSAEQSKVSRGCDLRLMSSVKDAGDIPGGGKNLIIVAAVNRVLHFRIFDGDGKMAADTDETRLTEKAQSIEDLRKQLASLWPPHKLTVSEKGQVIDAVTSIVGHTLSRLLAEFLIFDPLDPVHYYFRVHHNQIGLDDSLLYQLMKAEFGLTRADVRELLLPQLGTLFSFLHRLKSAVSEQERQAVVAEVRELRERLASVPNLDEVGARAFFKALHSHRFHELAPSPRTPVSQPALSIKDNEVTVASGLTYALDNDAQVAFVKALVDAGPGAYVSGREMGVAAQPHPERVFARLPQAIRAEIESKPGAGYRIRPRKLG
jgi:hypothetical protein